MRTGARISLADGLEEAGWTVVERLLPEHLVDGERPAPSDWLIRHNRVIADRATPSSARVVKICQRTVCGGA